jgi:hypothetical protein
VRPVYAPPRDSEVVVRRLVRIESHLSFNLGEFVTNCHGFGTSFHLRTPVSPWKTADRDGEPKRSVTESHRWTSGSTHIAHSSLLTALGIRSIRLIRGCVGVAGVGRVVLVGGANVGRFWHNLALV